MITMTMNASEMMRELYADEEQFITGKYLHERESIIKGAKKRHVKNDTIAFLEWRSKKQNNYTIVLEHTKKNFVRWTMYCWVQDRLGIFLLKKEYVQIDIPGVASISRPIYMPVLIYPHVIRRYGERFGQRFDNISLRNQFMVASNAICISNTDEEYRQVHGGEFDIMGQMMSGTLYGYYENGLIHMKTFIAPETLGKGKKELLNNFVDRNERLIDSVESMRVIRSQNPFRSDKFFEHANILK